MTIANNGMRAIHACSSMVSNVGDKRVHYQQVFEQINIGEFVGAATSVNDELTLGGRKP